MQKNMGDFARHLKKLMPTYISKDYVVKDNFKEFGNESEIREGVLAFYDFMNSICDQVISDHELSMIPRKGKSKLTDETTLTVEFPFLNNVKSILLNIGDEGLLSSDKETIYLNSWTQLIRKRSYNKNSTAKISHPQVIKALQFLASCGFGIEGVDFNMKKSEIESLEGLVFSYPSNYKVMIGLKTLSRSQDLFSSRANDEILLRCDYRTIADIDDITDFVVDDFVQPLSKELTEYVKEMHNFYLRSGMKCKVELGSFCIHLMYYHKSKLLWRYTSSLHNGYRILMKTKNSDNYMDKIDDFPQELLSTIKNGYGCDRKSGSGHGNCQRGCEGFRIPLNDSTLTIGSNLKKWQTLELESMTVKRKKK